MRRKEQKKFREVLNQLLSIQIRVETLPESIKRGVRGKKITMLEAVLLAQINKAIGGDTSSATFLRDTSGNKLKDGAVEIAEKRSFEDL